MSFMVAILFDKIKKHITNITNIVNSGFEKNNIKN